MRPLQSYGPSVVVFATAVLVLLLGPRLVRELTYAQTQAEVRLAADRLADANVLELFNLASRDIATLVEPSVVHVSTAAVVRDRAGRATRVVSSGSGWVYDDLGHVVSNAHVVDGATEIEVQFYTGESFDATIVGIDLRSDIAVLRVEASHPIPARRSPSESVRQGELVFAFGSPFDFRFSMSSGIVSGVGRAAGLTDIDYENFIQVDAAINPGNSGGPLTNIRGEVIGMNTAIATGRGNTPGQGLFAGIGLAIPMSMIESIVDQLIEKGEVDRGFVGVQVRDLNEVLARDLTYNGLGVIITDVTEGGPAERAGLRPRDIVTHVDGQAIDSTRLIPAIVGSHRPGEEIQFRIWRLDPVRGGMAMEVPVSLDKLDPAIIANRSASALRRFGLADLATATPGRAAEAGVAPVQGVLVMETRPGSDAEAMIEPGSTIVGVNGQPVANLDQFYTRLERQHDQSIGTRQLGVAVVALTIVTPQGEEREVRVGLSFENR